MPLYDTLGPDAVEYIIGHAEVTIVFASALKMRALVEPLSRAKGKVRAVIVWGEMDGIAKMVRQSCIPATGVHSGTRSMHALAFAKNFLSVGEGTRTALGSE